MNSVLNIAKIMMREYGVIYTWKASHQKEK